MIRFVLQFSDNVLKNPAEACDDISDFNFSREAMNSITLQHTFSIMRHFIETELIN